MPDTHALQPGQPVALGDIPTTAEVFAKDRAAARDEFRTLRRELIEWQRRLYAEGKQKLLIVLQAMDAGGKDGTIRNILKGVNPQGVRVESFKVPSKRELAHDFLWRVHRVVPGKGMITVFNRSHYEDVLVVRVEDIVPEAVWRPRFQAINDFERLLTESGTHILKFYLHISPGEQRERFKARLEVPEKHWKFSHADLDKAKDWDAYMVAYAEALEQCTTAAAPWHVVPADQKWYRNLAVMRTVVDRLRRMDPQYPPPEHDIKNVVIS
ncbi:MAG: polyphosphate kinase 2 family protein [Pseudomonadota bacterium]